MYNIDEKLLLFLTKLFPASFNKNLQNYYEFEKYFNLIPKEELNLSKYTKEYKSDTKII